MNKTLEHKLFIALLKDKIIHPSKKDILEIFINITFENDTVAFGFFVDNNIENMMTKIEWDSNDSNELLVTKTFWYSDDYDDKIIPMPFNTGKIIKLIQTFMLGDTNANN